MRLSAIRVRFTDGQTPTLRTGDALLADPRVFRQPAAFWRELVRRKPWLARYHVPLQAFDTKALIERLDVIRHDLADRGLDHRGGLPFAEAERVEALICDARALMCEEAGERTAPPPEPALSVDTATLCALCWRLAPIGTKRAGAPTDMPALCTLHSLAGRRKNHAHRASAKRRMSRIDTTTPPPNASVNDFVYLFKQQTRRADAPRWQIEIDAAFPRVAAAHPLARASVLGALDALDEMDMSAERIDLHTALAAPASSVTSSMDHDRRAGLLYAMLVTRELWLAVESGIGHGGRRDGAGRKPKTPRNAHVSSTT